MSADKIEKEQSDTTAPDNLLESSDSAVASPKAAQDAPPPTHELVLPRDTHDWQKKEGGWSEYRDSGFRAKIREDQPTEAFGPTKDGAGMLEREVALENAIKENSEKIQVLEHTREQLEAGTEGVTEMISHKPAQEERQPDVSSQNPKAFVSVLGPGDHVTTPGIPDTGKAQTDALTTAGMAVGFIGAVVAAHFGGSKDQKD